MYILDDDDDDDDMMMMMNWLNGMVDLAMTGSHISR